MTELAMTLIKPCLSTPEMNFMSRPGRGPIIPIELQNEIESAATSSIEGVEDWLRAHDWRSFVPTPWHTEYRRGDYSIILQAKEKCWHLWFLPEYKAAIGSTAYGKRGWRARGQFEFIHAVEALVQWAQ